MFPLCVSFLHVVCSLSCRYRPKPLFTFFVFITCCFRWYKEDLNTIPTSYILQPVSSWFPEYFNNDNDVSRDNARQEWKTEFDELKKALMNAVRKVFSDGEKFRRYARSGIKVVIWMVLQLLFKVIISYLS